MIGKRHLETALAQLAQQRPDVAVTVEWRSCPLFPTLPPAGIPQSQVQTGAAWQRRSRGAAAGAGMRRGARGRHHAGTRPHRGAAEHRACASPDPVCAPGWWRSGRIRADRLVV
ncbi:thioredoxin domain-containing protein [Cupriavidus necator]